MSELSRTCNCNASKTISGGIPPLIFNLSILTFLMLESRYNLENNLVRWLGNNGDKKNSDSIRPSCDRRRCLEDIS